MFESLPDDIRLGIEAARKKAQRKSSRLSVHVGDAIVPILRLREEGFTVEASRTARLRGFVDIYDGPRHISRALIVAASEDAGEMSYEFKRETVIGHSPIRDYADERPAPGGYLPRPA